ncbi:MAG: hypothetical protein ABIB11_06265, partial [Candidatus Omnitrophota bacterium]
MKRAFFSIFIMVIFFAGSLSYFFYKQMQDEISQILSIEKELKVVSEERLEMIEEIKIFTKDVEEAEIAINNSRTGIQEMRGELAESKISINELSGQIQSSESGLQALKEKLKTLIEEKNNAGAELKEARDERVSVLDQVSLLEKERLELQGKIKEAIVSLEGVELRKIIVKLHPPKEGRVVDINREYN